MNYKELIEELINELSYRVGVPNIHDKEHQSIMSQILTEWGEIDAKNTILSFITEKGKTPDMNQQKADTEGEDSDYSHIGRGFYVRSGDVGNDGKAKPGAQKYKNINGTMKAVSDDEYEKSKSDQGEEGEKAASTTPQNQQGSHGGGEAQEPEQGTAMKTKDMQDRVAKEDEVRKRLNGNRTDKEERAKEREIQKNLSKEQKSARGLLKKLNTQTLKTNYPELSDEALEDVENFKNLTDEFLNNATSDERKKEIALELKNSYGLQTNTEIQDEDGNPKQVKLYLRKLPSGGKVHRSIEKVLGANANSPSTNLTSELNKYLDEENQIKTKSVGGKSEQGLKIEFEAAAKPKFTSESGETKREKVRKNPKANNKQKDPNNPGYDKNGQPLTITDPLVSQIFKKGSVLGDLKESMHSLEGPADEDGNMIPCDSPENKRKHFNFLISNNESNQKVKQAAQKYINDPNVSETDKEKFRNIVKAMDAHEAGMKNLIDKIPSEEAEKEVKQLNAKLMDDLHNAYPEIASGMAKQFAENALVTQEIAAGDEVYMPSQGTFPGGDKILVTRNGAVMEAVAGVSVKFGRASKNTQTYGFPGEAQSMANFAELERLGDETDEQFEERKKDVRTRNGKYVGQDGYLLGVRDDIIKDEEKFNEVLTQSGLDETVTDKKKLHQLSNEIHSEIERYIQEQRDLGRSEKSIRISLQKHMKGWMSENNIQNKFEECVDRNKLTEKMTGSTDGNYIDEDGNDRTHDNTNLAQKCNPLEFLGVTSFASSIREGKGMPSLLWNHQSYEDGEYHSETTDPSDTDMMDLSNWGFSSRLWATDSRDGGGILATGTGEGELKNKPLKNS